MGGGYQGKGMTTPSDVVVGVDDSPESLEALRVAASEAALRGVGVLAIHVWHLASTWGVPLPWPEGANPGEFVEKRLADEARQLEAARRAAGEPPVNIAVEVIEGDTVKELRASATGAPMLVLGERHFHGPQSIIGSVSHDLAAHPPCPVLIVPAGASAARD
jgi:nucleotide-binding universal stress UspA family protein